jgi:hypothetical protein
MKVCRECHTVYKKFDYPHCENGCDRKPPYLLADGSPNAEIEPSMVILPKVSDKEIRWVCINCHLEFTQQEVKVKKFKCKNCQAENKLYPFTIKTCNTCKDDDENFHALPLTAKVCDLCGGTDFRLNNIKSISELLAENNVRSTIESKTVTSDLNSWSGPEAAEFHPTIAEVIKNTNMLSLTFTILNNNFEETLYGESKSYSLKQIIRCANGYIPDSIYEKLLEKYPDTLISFTFNDNQYRMETSMELLFAELDVKFHAKDTPVKWDSSQTDPLPENKLLQFKGDFLKFNIWVY